MGYKEGYLYMFNKYTDIIELCKGIQTEAEEKVISGSDAEVVLLDKVKPDDEHEPD